MQKETFPCNKSYIKMFHLITVKQGLAWEAQRFPVGMKNNHPALLSW